MIGPGDSWVILQYADPTCPYDVFDFKQMELFTYDLMRRKKNAIET